MLPLFIIQFHIGSARQIFCLLHEVVEVQSTAFYIILLSLYAPHAFYFVIQFIHLLLTLMCSLLTSPTMADSTLHASFVLGAYVALNPRLCSVTRHESTKNRTAILALRAKPSLSSVSVF